MEQLDWARQSSEILIIARSLVRALGIHEHVRREML